MLSPAPLAQGKGKHSGSSYMLCPLPQIHFQQLPYTPTKSPHTKACALYKYLSCVLSAEDPQVEGSAQSGWFSLQMGPVGHLRLQLDLHANSRVPQPALHSLREGPECFLGPR